MSFKRRVLSALDRKELLDIGRRLELDVSTRLTSAELVDVVAGSKRARLSEIVTEAMSRDLLKEICAACGLDDIGKEKAVLVERILEAAEPKPEASYRRSVAAEKPERAAEAAAVYGRDRGAPTARPRSKRATDRRRAGVADSEAIVSGSLKSALRQFSLGAAGGYSGRYAGISFATHLLECFGWPGGRPEGAEIPAAITVAEGGVAVQHDVTLWWPARGAMLEVIGNDAPMSSAWTDVLRVCLQVKPSPQYVVLTNQRDLHLYDLGRDRTAPRLAIPVDALPKYSEAFPFFTKEWVPGTTPKIVDVEKVSTEVADLVARLYLSVLAKHPGRAPEVTRFILQCITAMFAEDIGLLPANHFTSLLYAGARSGDIEQRLHELFVQMNTRDLPTPRIVPYFNGGLFTEVVTPPLGSEQIVALTKAAEANWTFVEPHIFGSVFQGVMDAAERHASGAHYTAKDDIMRVVGPTIVDPWRRRIQAAASLRELTELRKELFAYRVLDPACGSGNFLYIAFRELYRLDTELLSRMREFPSTQGKLSWNGGISARNFFGMDINPFAVELAKVTLNIAKKIAYEERRAQAFALEGQVELDLDPSLPLDNLDDNIVCKDALFCDWPEVEAIVGNPPMLGGRKVRKELGTEYLRRLQSKFPAVDSRGDYCCYWFRLAHSRLGSRGRAGLIGTSGIRIGNAREATLEYIVSNGGTITNAVSSRVWPGEASINVSIVNWSAAPTSGPFYLTVDEQIFALEKIPTHLELHADLGSTKPLMANSKGSSMGATFGHAAFTSRESEFPESVQADRLALRNLATASDLLRNRLDGKCIWLAQCETAEAARRVGRAAFEYLHETVYPLVRERADNDTETDHYKHWVRSWWKAQMPRTDFFALLAEKRRFVVCPRSAHRSVFVFLSSRFVANPTLQLFAFDDDYSFGILQSDIHWKWVVGKGTRVRDDITYSSDVWRTFAWPQEPTTAQVQAIAELGQELRRTREVLIARNGWSLRQLYQAAEIVSSHPLKDAQVALDDAVRHAYGIPERQDSLNFLLELNHLVAEDEQQGRKIRGPGLPDHLDPNDPRWMSSDCIEPPPMGS